MKYFFKCNWSILIAYARSYVTQLIFVLSWLRIFAFAAISTCDCWDSWVTSWNTRLLLCNHLTIEAIYESALFNSGHNCITLQWQSCWTQMYLFFLTEVFMPEEHQCLHSKFQSYIMKSTTISIPNTMYPTFLLLPSLIQEMTNSILHTFHSKRQSFKKKFFTPFKHTLMIIKPALSFYFLPFWWPQSFTFLQRSQQIIRRE